jgi:hypothetical protein
MCVHGMLPLGYFVFMGTFSDQPLIYQLLFDREKLSIWWQIYFNVSILFAVFVFSLVYYWKQNKFCQHPVAVKLKRFSSNSSWNSIANQINIGKLNKSYK